MAKACETLTFYLILVCFTCVTKKDKFVITIDTVNLHQVSVIYLQNVVHKNRYVQLQCRLKTFCNLERTRIV